MKVDKRTKQMPIVVTDPERESILDFLHVLNKDLRAQGVKPYSFSAFALEAILEKIEREGRVERAPVRSVEEQAADMANRIKHINRDRAHA